MTRFDRVMLTLICFGAGINDFNRGMGYLNAGLDSVINRPVDAADFAWFFVYFLTAGYSLYFVTRLVRGKL